MEITASPLDWTTIDEENLAKFLDTPTGQRFIPALAERCPDLLERGHVNAILIRTGEVRAYRGVLRDIIFLAHPPKPAAAAKHEEYAPLEDDTKWQGAKLNDTSAQAWKDLGLEPPTTQTPSTI